MISRLFVFSSVTVAFFCVFRRHLGERVSSRDENNERVSNQYAALLSTHRGCVVMSCPVAPQWVSGCLWEADWLAGPDEGHVLLSSGNRWPHRVTSPRDQWHDRHS